jgi:hypothetical protein
VAGDGVSATEQRTVPDFTAVMTQHLRVLVRQGSPASVTVQGDRNLLAQLESVVEDGAQGKTLVLRWKPGIRLNPRLNPTITVVAPAVGALLVAGSGDIVGEQLKSARLLAQVDGSGDVRLNGVGADELSLAVKGSGDIVASGQAARLAVSIAGSGDVKTGQLKADEVSVGITGSGDASVHAERTLTVSIAGSGDVVYTGNATLKKSIAGSGSVTHR